jgi:hypothetical protein
MLVWLLLLLASTADANPTTAVVVNECREDLRWLRKLPVATPVFLTSCVDKNELDRDIDDLCSEAYGYFKWVYDNYDRLATGWPADILFFTHGHEFSWHYKTSIAAQIAQLLAEQPEYIERNRMGMLNCEITQTGGKPDFAPHGHGPSRNMDRDWLWSVLFRDTSVQLPTDYYIPCCGTFWVRSRTLTESRRRGEYAIILENLAASDPQLSKQLICGRIAESGWGAAFANMTRFEVPPFCAPPKPPAPPPPRRLGAPPRPPPMRRAGAPVEQHAIRRPAMPFSRNQSARGQQQQQRAQWNR